MTNYEKFLECKSKSNKASKEVDVMCFKENSLIQEAINGIKGTGNPNLPSYGNGQEYILFNDTDNLVMINFILVSHDEADLLDNVPLSCSPKILYPKVKTRIACYNYEAVDNIFYKRYVENNKKKLTKSWFLGSTSVLNIQTKFKKP